MASGWSEDEVPVDRAAPDEIVALEAIDRQRHHRLVLQRHGIGFAVAMTRKVAVDRRATLDLELTRLGGQVELTRTV